MPLLSAAAVAVGAALQSATGFGFSLVAAPIVFAAVGPPEAVGLLLVLSVEMNLLMLLTERRRPRPLGRDTVMLLAGAAPGAVAGVAVLQALDAVALQVAVSVGVVATLIARWVGDGRRTPEWAAPLAGFASGGLTTSTTTAGPPLLVYLLGRGLEPARVRDTVTVTFLGLNAIGAGALWYGGVDAVPDAALVAILVPIAAAGHLAGRPIFARLARGGGYEPVLTAVLLVSVVSGLAGATL